MLISRGGITVMILRHHHDGRPIPGWAYERGRAYNRKFYGISSTG